MTSMHETNQSNQTNSTTDDGFTIFRRPRRRNNNRTNNSEQNSGRYDGEYNNRQRGGRRGGRGGRGGYNNGRSRRTERMHLLQQVASGDMEPDAAVRLISRTYSQPPLRFHHRVTHDGRISIEGIVANQTLTLCIDEWQKVASYLNGQNFNRFVTRNESRLRTRRRPRRQNNNESASLDETTVDPSLQDDVTATTTTEQADAVPTMDPGVQNDVTVQDEPTGQV